MTLDKTHSTTVHGVFMAVQGLGILLTGKSGIGKSELALGLVSRGHALIADDAVLLQRTQTHTILGSCPRELRYFLEVRGLGVLNIKAMFGEHAVAPSKPLDLHIQLVELTEHDLASLDRLHGMHGHYEALGIKIPSVSIPVAAGRNLAVLVEAAVRNQQLRSQGYSASIDFENRLTDIMNQEEA